MTAKIFVFANQKGGVAKTTTTVNLGAYLAAAGRRILVVDTDPQSNATTSLGIDPRKLDVSIYDVLIRNVAAQRAVTLTDRVNLDLLPASQLRSRQRGLYQAPYGSWSCTNSPHSEKRREGWSETSSPLAG